MKDLSIIGDDGERVATAITNAGARLENGWVVFDSKPTLKSLTQLYDVCRDQYRRGTDYLSWIKWMVGDLLNHGEAHYKEKIFQLIDPDDFPESAPADWKWLSKKVPAAMRRHGLTWAKHRDCAGIEDATARAALISEAVAKNLTHEEIRKRKAEIQPRPSKKPEVKGEFTIEDGELDVQIFNEENVLSAAIYKKMNGVDRMECARRLVKAVSGE